ncbi:MAG: hypothetical protein NC131_16630 [Roseburia sp.]|nr:hypothetical protein [Roseburia sp.]
MKTRLLCQLKSSLLLLLWLLLTQTIADLLLAAAAMLALLLGAVGIFPLVGPTPLWVWIAGGVLTGLFWLAMGWSAPRAVRTGTVGTAAALAVWSAGTAAALAAWSALTSLVSVVYFLCLAQKFCGGMLLPIPQSLGCDLWTAEQLARTAACFLLPAVLGVGLLLRRRRTAAGRDGENG